MLRVVRTLFTGVGPTLSLPPLLCYILAALHLSNSTTPLIVLHGWIASPQLRAIFDILSSCLIAIVASIWTISHLNVPGAKDARINKFFALASWMSRLLRSRIHYQWVLSPIATNPSKRTDPAHETGLEAQDSLDLGVDVTAKGQRPFTTRYMSEGNKTKASTSKEAHVWTPIHAILCNL